MPRSNEGMRLIFSAVVGVMLGYLFGISFPTVNITKVKWPIGPCFLLSFTLFRGKKILNWLPRSFTSLRVSSPTLKIGTLASQPKHCWTMHGHLQIIVKRTILIQTLTKFPRYFVTLVLHIFQYCHMLCRFYWQCSSEVSYFVIL